MGLVRAFIRLGQGSQGRRLLLRLARRCVDARLRAIPSATPGGMHAAPSVFTWRACGGVSPVGLRGLFG